MTDIVETRQSIAQMVQVVARDVEHDLENAMHHVEDQIAQIEEAGPRVESRRPSKDLTDTRRSSVDFPETSAAVEGTAQGESVVGAVDAAVLQATLQGLQRKSSA